MDQFYNENCFDERVRYMQGARMRLAELVYAPVTTKKENVELPWSQNGFTATKQSLSNLNKSLTPNKITKKNQLNQKEKSKSPIQPSRSPFVKQKKQIPRRESEEDHDERVFLQGHKQDEPEYFVVKDNGKIKKPQQQELKGNKSSRKMEHLPQKSGKVNSIQSNRPTDRDSIKTNNNKIKNPTLDQKSKLAAKPPQRTLAQSNENSSSMKKLNDLIFTIKMTKQEYDDFMEVKKMLNSSAR